jgi:hypothetical protein
VVKERNPTMWTGVQWTGTIASGATERWFTWGWPSAWHVVWYLMPTTQRPGSPELAWNVAVERADGSECTYWITVTNLAPLSVTFEGRFAVLS